MTSPATITLRLTDPAQLLDVGEPSPFRDSGLLQSEAADAILRKARQLPRSAPIRIVIELPADKAVDPGAAGIGPAIVGHCSRRAEEESEAMRELFRNGRISALMGVTLLSTCLFFAWHIANSGPPRPLTRIAQESFVILGWVSVWRPMEILVYEWVPIARRRQLYRRLAAAEILIQPYASAA